MSNWIDHRRAGVLLHITSLPGPFAQGVLGEEARAFIDEIAGAGFTVWQFLPLGPTHGHGSPYETLSSSAGNPKLLDMRDCVARGWLDDALLQQHLSGELSEEELRAAASTGFWTAVESTPALQEALNAFIDSNRYWLDDYLLFAAYKKVSNDLPWWEWPQGIKERKPAALQGITTEFDALIRQTKFEQFLFAYQWQMLKSYAEERGVLLFGDLPIYVAHDSVDVWAHRQFFTVNEEGLCEEVAGVPPDYFSETGQRWGNPLYRWEALQAEHFSWWIHRVQTQLARMHMVRIDHFRGLESYWAIPAEHDNGVIGEWRTAPGAELLDKLNSRLGKVPFVAEDLGLITHQVEKLRDAFGLPGMKILQFAFGGEADNPYLPHNHIADSVAYTGTHDNDTTLGWFTQADAKTQDHVRRYLGSSCDDIPWPLIRATLASPAILAVLPMQDLLSLGSEARFNTPGTLEGNWEWRLEQQLADETRIYLKEMNALYGRL